MSEPTPTAAEVPPGLSCPGCRSLSSHVLFTRPAVNQVLRSRKCNGCGRRFRTSERIVATNDPGRGDQAAPAAPA